MLDYAIGTIEAGGNSKMNKYIQPNLQKAAVITIDTQNDFSLPGAVAEIKGTFDVLPNVNKILEVCRKYHMTIVHVIRIYKEDGTNVDLCRRELIESGVSIASPGSTGVELVNAVKPLNSDPLHYEELLQGGIQSISKQEWVIYKPRWGAFYQTQLEKFLRGLDIDTLIFIGCNFPNCPRTSIYEASERDFKIIMVEDAVSGVYEKGLEEIKNIGVQVYTTNDLIEEVSSIYEEGPNSI